MYSVVLNCIYGVVLISEYIGTRTELLIIQIWDPVIHLPMIYYYSMHICMPEKQYGIGSALLQMDAWRNRLPAHFITVQYLQVTNENNDVLMI